MNTRKTTNILLTLIAGLLIALVASPASNSATQSTSSLLRKISNLEKRVKALEQNSPALINFLTPEANCGSGVTVDSTKLMTGALVGDLFGKSTLTTYKDTFDVCQLTVLVP
jgi:hypothetical protein